MKSTTDQSGFSGREKQVRIRANTQATVRSLCGMLLAAWSPSTYLLSYWRLQSFYFRSAAASLADGR